MPMPTPLLWVLRENLQLTGTKFGCGWRCARLHRASGRQAGALLLDAVSAAAGEDHHHRGRGRHAHRQGRAGGLEPDRRAAVRLLPVGPDHERLRAAGRKKAPSDADIDAAMSGNICRCGTYNQIRAAIHDASATLVKGA